MTYEMNTVITGVEFAETENEVEAKLTNEIRTLWCFHQARNTTAKITKQELKTVRLNLGRKLCEMKSILARTGRGGGWAAYLRSCELPRASAERYIYQHELASKPKSIESRGAISETNADDVRRLVRSLLPKLKKVLTTESWVQWFLAELEFQLETANGIPTDGGIDKAGLVPLSDPGSNSCKERATA
jgi:hypothetical protein